MALLLTAYGLGILGSTSLQSIASHSTMAIGSIAAGLAVHALALYIVPYG
jgi:hypothetical protein